jgi:ADP-ribosyl-[dinitrogen reductase] hydrolase
MKKTSTLSKMRGAMTAAAIGGALGNPSGLITDDMQMALFTAEGLILYRVRADYRDREDVTEPVFHSLLRWLYTQQTYMMGELVSTFGTCAVQDGILMGHKELFALRNPSDTCLSVLTSGKMGTREHPPNNEKGPGALARTLPVGLSFTDPVTAFNQGCNTAAITHGHPDALLSSGFFAALICHIIAGQPLSWAMTGALKILRSAPDSGSVVGNVEKASSLSTSGDITPDTIDHHFKERSAVHVLGAGLFCALSYQNDLNRGLLLSVDHSGSVDETGAVAGAILGALHGYDTLPVQLLAGLELKSVILEMADDLFERFHPSID